MYWPIQLTRVISLNSIQLTAFILLFVGRYHISTLQIKSCSSWHHLGFMWMYNTKDMCTFSKIMSAELVLLDLPHRLQISWAKTAVSHCQNWFEIFLSSPKHSVQVSVCEQLILTHNQPRAFLFGFEKKREKKREGNMGSHQEEQACLEETTPAVYQCHIVTELLLKCRMKVSFSEVHTQKNIQLSS